MTVTLRVAVCVSEPEVPVNVTVPAVGEALLAAENCSCVETPELRLRLGASAVTPEGRPLIWTAIVEEKLLVPAAETETNIEPPAGMVMDVGLTATEKSPVTGGGAGGVVLVELLPPQPARPAEKNTRMLRAW